MLKNKMFSIGINCIPNISNKLRGFNIFQKSVFRNFLTYQKFSLKNNYRQFPIYNFIFDYEMPALKAENNLFDLQKREMRSAKTKRKLKLPDQTYKMKTKNAARKRFRIIGKLFDKHFRHWPNNKRHKMLNKSRSNLKRKKSERYVHTTNMRHLKRLFPYFKRKKYRN
jgi:ribosomal protein L35